MAETMSRKQFLLQTLLQTAQASKSFLQAISPQPEPLQNPSQYPFESDFSPELLEKEAHNMSLDPHNKKAVLAAIAKKLGPPGS